MFGRISHFFRIIAKRLWASSTATFLTVIVLWWFYGTFFAFLTLLVGLSTICYNAQDLLLYHPNDPPDSRVFILQPSVYKLPYESIKIPTKDGFMIHLFLIKKTDTGANLPTLLFFHGNAGNMGQRLANINGLYKNLQINILMMEYRGYGLSEGSPSENGMYKDSQAAFEYLLKRNDINSSKIILFGRSLGGAVAIDLASRMEYRGKIWALIVENTFTSIPDMAKIILQWRCLRLLPRLVHKNKYTSLEKIGHVIAPTLVVCGTNDTLVPPSMSESLHSRCAALHKKLVMIPGGGHDDTWTCRDYYPTLQQFIENLPPVTHEPYHDEEFAVRQKSSHCVLVHDV